MVMKASFINKLVRSRLEWAGHVERIGDEKLAQRYSFYIYISYILYILTYTYANVLNYILFHSILTNILCMFYVPFSIAMIAQSEKTKQKTYYYYTCMYYLLCTHYTYFICFIAVILNTLYVFLCFMSRCFTLVCRKIAQMS
jgi:hypothetical protein